MTRPWLHTLGKHLGPRVGYLVSTLVGATALALVFAAYLQPEFVMNLANQIWACF